MRNFRFLAAPVTGLAVLAACLSVSSGQAQVNQRALDQLGPAPGGAAPAVTQPRPRQTAHEDARHSHPNGPHQKLPPLKPAPGAPSAVVVPPAPPPVPVLPPPIVVPTRPAPPPAPAPVSPDAPNTTSDLPGGLRVTFGGDRFDLNPATDAALRALVSAAKPGAGDTYTVTSYAAGSADDPSSPRRLSLSRALSVRSVLMAAGVPSVRIYVKALGASSPSIADGPPDRVDVTVISQPPPAAPAPSQKAAP
jgi:outer membrane protein OmpA-like peptidoglycan-associated protein